MAKIKTLYQNGQQIMPVTHPKAVMDDDGETLEAKLSKINKRLEACGNGGSMSGQLVGSASGTSVSVSDALAAPLMGLRVWGKSTQDGVPTPTAPVPIVSAGDGGTVVVTVSDGANESQTLTLQTPNALPGIPVTSGGNYTDENGQQWVCDEVDLEKGVKVQRVNAVDFSTCEIVGNFNLGVTKRITYTLPLNACDADTNALCNKLQHRASFDKDTPHFYADAVRLHVFIPIGAKNPEEGEYILFYALATPIETPLTPAEIAAYKALTTYAPTTTISVSDGAGATVTYQRDAILVIKRLEEAIASTAAVSSLSM